MSRPRIVCVLLALVTALVYLPVRHYALVNFDDDMYVTENPMVQGGLTWMGVKWAFTTLHASNWHPLTWLSLMLDCQMFGLSAGAHHLINVALHAANAVLLFVLLLRLTASCWPSAFIAALFAWHPLHVESVAWVSERKDVLSAFFGFLTLLAYVHYAQKRRQGTGKSQSTGVVAISYGLALLFFAMCLMAKPMLVTVPFIFLLLDYWPLQRVPDFDLRFSHWFPLVREKVPFFILSVASCVITFVAQQRSASVTPLATYPLFARIVNAPVAYVKYLFDSVYPVNLAVIYPLPLDMSWIQAAAAMLVLVVITGLIWRARRRCPYLITGWFWYLGMMLPVIGLVQVGSQAMADRYTYLPLIGLFLGVTFGMGDLALRLRLKSTVLIPVAILVLAGSLWGTAQQLQYWRNSETLFRHTLTVTKDNPTAQNNLGAALVEAGRLQEAIGHFQEALRLYGVAKFHDNLDMAMTHNNVGNLMLHTGHNQEGIEQLKEALRLEPDSALIHYGLGSALLQTGQPREAIEHFRAVLRLEPDNASTHNNLAVALDQTGQPEQAIKQYQEALRFQPNSPEAHCNLGFSLTEVGRPAEAITHFERALQLQPKFSQAHFGLGLVQLRNGQTEEAIAHFRTALQLQPDFADAHNYLGNALLRWGYVLFQKGQMNQALAPLQEGVQIHPDNATAYNCLGRIFLGQGQTDEALVNFQKALLVQPDNVEIQNNLAWVLATAPDAVLRNGVKAVELAQRANQISGGRNAAILETLAAAYAEVGRFPEAVATTQKALQLAESQTNTILMVNDLQTQIRCYQAGKPFRDHRPSDIQPATR